MTNHQSLVDEIYNADRVVVSAQLGLPLGQQFLQPTGFPDIGACIYTGADGQRRCLIESEQSMANRLEAVCICDPGRWAADLAFLPLIEVRDSVGRLLTTNLTEPHRIASSYILESTLGGTAGDVKGKIEQVIGLTNGGASWPLDGRKKLEALVFALDPAALIHGFQFVQWKFVGLRQTRLLSARIECALAEDPDVDYGMVKFDFIDPNGHSKSSNKGQSIAAKNRVVPHKDGVLATFDIDVLGIKSLSLPERQKKFLFGLALYKIGAFLSNKPSFDARSRQSAPALKLRADCYLEFKKAMVTINGATSERDLADFCVIPARLESKELAEQQGFTLCTEAGAEGIGAEQPVLNVKYTKGVTTGTNAEDDAETGTPLEVESAAVAD